MILPRLDTSGVMCSPAERGRERGREGGGEGGRGEREEGRERGTDGWKEGGEGRSVCVYVRERELKAKGMFCN